MAEQLKTDFVRRRRITALLVALICVAIIAAFSLTQLGPSRGAFFYAWSDQWRLDSTQVREAISRRGGIIIREGRYVWIGPVVVTRWWKECVLRPMGTNLPSSGSIIYNPTSWREMGKVLRVDPAYEFPDGTIRPSVLLKNPNGGETWVPQENLGKVLVEDH